MNILTRLKTAPRKAWKATARGWGESAIKMNHHFSMMNTNKHQTKFLLTG